MKKASSVDHSHSARGAGRLLPRKKPRQERSAVTVDAILQGAIQVLVKVGYERANTTLIARAAGVSVGSLYQYYPNKDAVFSALLQREIGRATELMQEMAVADPGAPFARRLLGVISTLLAYKAQNPRLHRVLKTELGRIEGTRTLRRLNERSLELVEHMLRAHQHELRLQDPVRAAFFAVNTVEGIVCAALLDAPERLSEPEFARELSGAVLAMLGSLPQLKAAEANSGASAH